MPASMLFDIHHRISTQKAFKTKAHRRIHWIWIPRRRKRRGRKSRFCFLKKCSKNIYFVGRSGRRSAGWDYCRRGGDQRFTRCRRSGINNPVSSIVPIFATRRSVSLRSWYHWLYLSQSRMHSAHRLQRMHLLTIRLPWSYRQQLSSILLPAFWLRCNRTKRVNSSQSRMHSRNYAHRLQRMNLLLNWP